MVNWRFWECPIVPRRVFKRVSMEDEVNTVEC